MNAPEYPKIDDTMLDMLVDGELSEEERRKLLLSLEKTRRVAARTGLPGARELEGVARGDSCKSPRPGCGKRAAAASRRDSARSWRWPPAFSSPPLLGPGIDNMLESPARIPRPTRWPARARAQAPLKTGPRQSRRARPPLRILSPINMPRSRCPRRRRRFPVDRTTSSLVPNRQRLAQQRPLCRSGERRSIAPATGA